MLPSRSSLWPSLTLDSAHEEGTQRTGYTCDYSHCSYLPSYDGSASTTSAPSYWQESSNLQSNRCDTPFWTTSCQSRASVPCCCGDDLMWKDPCEASKKYDCDSGVALWGDPDVANSKPVRRWLIGEGEDEDLESALLSRSVSPSEGAESNFERAEQGDFAHEVPFPLPKHPSAKIIPTGWIDLPSRESPSFARHTTSAKTRNYCSLGLGDLLEYSEQSSTFTTAHNDLNPLAAQFIGYLHALVPGLRAIEMDLEQIVNQVKNGIITEEQVARFLSQREKVDYNRLVVGITSLRAEIANFSRRMQSNARASGSLLQDQAQAIYDLPFTL